MRSTPALFVLVTVVLLPLAAHAADRHVPGTYPTIQGAIVAAGPGDRVLVAPGTYVENIDFLGKAITVESLRGPALTVIDGSSPSNPARASVVTFENGEGPDSVLRGFTLRGGAGATVGGPLFFLRGGGVYCESGSPTIENNVVTANSAYEGGGLWFHDLAPTIRGNRIHGNSADWGAGILCEATSGTISGNLIYGNATSDNFSVGGGVCIFESVMVLSNNVIWGNYSFTEAGGIFVGWYSSLTLVNNVIAQNITQGKGGGLHIEASSADVVNTVIWQNSAATGEEVFLGDIFRPSTLTFAHSDVRGGQSLIAMDAGSSFTWGAGMIDADPLFADPAAIDFHLRWDSPCRNAGDDAAVVDAFDFEGDDRIVQGAVDMGADEFHTRLYLVGTPAPGTSVSVKVVGTPGSPMVFLAQGLALLDPPLSLPYGDLYLVWPFPWFSNLGGIPASGIRARPAAIPSDWSPTGLYPFQALVVSPTLSWELTNPLILW